jgi:hypothetical protein
MDLFLEACGAAGPLHLDVTSPGEATVRRVFHQPFVRIGFERGSDLVLSPGRRPFRGQIYLQVIAGRLFCADLREESRRKVRARTRKSGWLGPHGALQLGPHVIRFPEIPEPADEPSPLAPAAPTPPGTVEAALELLNGQTARPPRPLRRVLTLVGRSPYCGLRLLGQSISDFHGALLRTPRGVWLVDLQGRGGVLVNGQAVSYTRLEDGDHLLVGKFFYRLHAPASPEPEEHPALPVPVPQAAGSLPAPAPLATPLRDLRWQLFDWMAEASSQQEEMLDSFQRTLLTLVGAFSNQRHQELAALREELRRLDELTRDLRELRSALGAGEAATGKRVLTGTAGPAVAASVHPLKGPLPPPTPSFPPGGSPAADSYDWLCRRIESMEQQHATLWRKVLSSVLGSAGR